MTGKLFQLGTKAIEGALEIKLDPGFVGWEGK